MHPATAEALRHWDQLHAQPRFRPVYPSEPAVRFLVGHFPDPARGHLHALDIGVGGGRHTKLLCDLGFRTAGVDISAEGLRHCRRWLEDARQRATLAQAEMTRLPFLDVTFDTAIAYGVYYYADAAGMARAIAELYRVLRRGAPGLVVLRSIDDYRCGKGACLGPGTYRLEIEETNEYGTVQHFLSEDDVPRMFRAFAELHFEKAETTFGERHAKNSDWLIHVRR